MKKNKLLMISAILTAFLSLSLKMSAQTDGTPTDTFEKMSFSISATKTDYLPLEPINLTCRFSNETAEVQTTALPDCLADSRLLVKANGQTNVFSSLSFVGGYSIRIRTEFQPESSTEQNINLEYNLEEFFPQEGVYLIQLILDGPNGKQLISNTLEISIKEPAGIDKDALTFIRDKNEFSLLPVLFFWNLNVVNASQENLLEEFVRRFGESQYCEYASLVLAHRYLYLGNRTRASIEFEKLRESTNPFIMRKLKKDF